MVGQQAVSDRLYRLFIDTSPELIVSKADCHNLARPHSGPVFRIGIQGPGLSAGTAASTAARGSASRQAYNFTKFIETGCWERESACAFPRHGHGPILRRLCNGFGAVEQAGGRPSMLWLLGWAWRRGCHRKADVGAKSDTFGLVRIESGNWPYEVWKPGESAGRVIGGRMAQGRASALEPAAAEQTTSA